MRALIEMQYFSVGITHKLHNEWTFGENSGFNFDGCPNAQWTSGFSLETIEQNAVIISIVNKNDWHLWIIELMFFFSLFRAHISVFTGLVTVALFYTMALEYRTFEQVNSLRNSVIT